MDNTWNNSKVEFNLQQLTPDQAYKLIKFQGATPKEGLPKKRVKQTPY